MIKGEMTNMCEGPFIMTVDELLKVACRVFLVCEKMLYQKDQAGIT